MMGLEEIKAANEDPAAFRKSRDEATERNKEWNAMPRNYPDHGNYWPGKYGSPASAYKPPHGGYPEFEPTEGDTETPKSPVPGSDWSPEGVDMDQQIRRASFKRQDAATQTIADRLRQQPDALEFDAARLANTLSIIADETAVNNQRLKALLSEYRKEPERYAEQLYLLYSELNRGDVKLRQEIEDIANTIDAERMDAKTPHNARGILSALAARVRKLSELAR